MKEVDLFKVFENEVSDAKENSVLDEVVNLAPALSQGKRRNRWKPRTVQKMVQIENDTAYKLLESTYADVMSTSVEFSLFPNNDSDVMLELYQNDANYSKDDQIDNLLQNTEDLRISKKTTARSITGKMSNTRVEGDLALLNAQSTYENDSSDTLLPLTEELIFVESFYDDSLKQFDEYINESLNAVSDQSIFEKSAVRHVEGSRAGSLLIGQDSAEAALLQQEEALYNETNEKVASLLPTDFDEYAMLQEFRTESEKNRFDEYIDFAIEAQVSAADHVTPSPQKERIIHATNSPPISSNGFQELYGLESQASDIAEFKAFLNLIGKEMSKSPQFIHLLTEKISSVYNPMTGKKASEDILPLLMKEARRSSKNQKVHSFVPRTAKSPSPLTEREKILLKALAKIVSEVVDNKRDSVSEVSNINKQLNFLGIPKTDAKL